jgi:hypothetical protein
MIALLLLVQVIPDDRLADWARAGAPAMPARTRVVELSGDVQAAIDAAEPDSILLLPAGTYDGLRLKSRVTLRGEGPTRTILTGPLSFGSGGANWWYADRLKLDVQGKRGVESLRVADPSKLKAGMVVQLARRNDPELPVVSPDGRDFLQRQLTQVVSVTATHATVSPAPLFDLPEGSRLTPAGRLAEFVGVEDLGIEGAGRIGINIAGAYGCWVKNVAVRGIETTSISMSDAFCCEITRCFIAAQLEAGGAGIHLGTSSFCKIEDNILLEQSPNIQVTASSGNVIAYNLCRDADLYGQVGPSLSTNQHPHSSFNLYEGNVAPKIQADGHYGSGSHDMIFRNRLHGTSTSTAKSWICVRLAPSMRNCSIVGNVLGAPGHPWIYEGHGADQRFIYSFGRGTNKEPDPGVLRTALVKGNFNWKDARVPEVEAVDVLPKSLYLKSKPAWWGDAAWPPFGPDVSFEKNKIPAETR